MERNSTDKLDFLYIVKLYPLKFNISFTELSLKFSSDIEHFSFVCLRSLHKLYIKSLSKPLVKEAKAKLLAFFKKRDIINMFVYWCN